MSALERLVASSPKTKNGLHRLQVQCRGVVICGDFESVFAQTSGPLGRQARRLLKGLCRLGLRPTRAEAKAERRGLREQNAMREQLLCGGGAE